MIEHYRAVENLDSILSVEGLDAILIGPYDLSASMGMTAQFTHPDFTATIQKILELSSQNSTAAGIHVVQPSRSELRQRIDGL